MTEVTRAQLIEQLMAENTRARRCPRHHVDTLAAIHARINTLLTQLDMLTELETMD